MTDLFRELFGPGAALTKPETRMMICDNESGYPLTNHQLNDAGEWICMVCGHNVNTAMDADHDAIVRMGQFIGALSTRGPETRTRWLGLFVEVLAQVCGDSALQDLTNILGRRKL